jgi:hypothetical protein
MLSIEIFLATKEGGRSLTFPAMYSKVGERPRFISKVTGKELQEIPANVQRGRGVETVVVCLMLSSKLLASRAV